MEALDNIADLLKKIEKDLVQARGAPTVIEPYLEELDRLADYGRHAKTILIAYRELTEPNDIAEEAVKSKPELGKPMTYGEMLMHARLLGEGDLPSD